MKPFRIHPTTLWIRQRGVLTGIMGICFHLPLEDLMPLLMHFSKERLSSVPTPQALTVSLAFLLIFICKFKSSQASIKLVFEYARTTTVCRSSACSGGITFCCQLYSGQPNLMAVSKLMWRACIRSSQFSLFSGDKFCIITKVRLLCLFIFPDIYLCYDVELRQAASEGVLTEKWD